MFAGLKIVRPNEARVFTLFGVYYGTVKTAGFHYVNPFCVSFSPTYNAAKAEAAQKVKDAVKQGGTAWATVHEPKTVSLKKQTLDNQRQKVNDILGNPIIIGAIVIWHVENPTQAVFSVENYREFVSIQTDSIIRNVSRLYPYDVFTEDENCDGIREKTLRGSALEIAEMMRVELQKRVDNAGLTIEEVRITHLAYAEEIAAAMLQRQQATAIIAARQKIVDGAVGMVKMAIDKLGDDNIVILDEERKAAMVSNCEAPVERISRALPFSMMALRNKSAICPAALTPRAFAVFSI
jgi:regulator of protease activity HflC (stomatin/prohibitin superfamily)